MIDVCTLTTAGFLSSMGAKLAILKSYDKKENPN